MTKVARWLLALGLTLGCALAAASPGRAQQMAITFDDLPVHGPLPHGQTRLGVAQSILGTLQAQHMPPTYGFINGRRVAQHPETRAVLSAWRAAGQPLGNHTWDHPDINSVPAPRFEADIARNEPLLAQLAGDSDWHWFRYPFLHEGDTLDKRRQVRAWLTAHGYHIAEVNMDFADYLWNEPYARCVARHDDRSIQRLHDSYLATADRFVGFFRTMSQEVYGRDVRYILLMHLGAFDAKMLPELLQLYRTRGFSFISLPEAEADPAYHADPDIADDGGGTLMEQVILAKKMPYPGSDEKPEKELDRICR